jgi:hypothetical protein
MIRVDTTPAAVIDAVNAIKPKWIGKADKLTAAFVAAKKYEESSPMWSEVKPAFMALQNNKCIFCERQFESELYGKIEFDLEHFRPKSSVLGWPVAGRHSYTYKFPTGGDNPAGYYWLPYALSNYAASCKVCNSNLKSNFFPVAGPRITEPGDLAGEKALLCYPLGDADVDPEELVTFIATTAVPKAKTGPKRRRGQIIIDFFDLNKREQLHRERANMIIILGNALFNVANGLGDETDEQLIASLVEPIYPHTNCLRAFRAVWAKDRTFALKALKACKAYYAAGKGATPPSL